VNEAEVVAKLVNHGMPAAEAQAAFDALHAEVAHFDSDLAALPGRYVRKDISLGDRCFLASVFQYGRGYTSDRDLSRLLGQAAPALEFFR